VTVDQESEIQNPDENMPDAKVTQVQAIAA